MIIDYKPELIHEHTALGCISEFLKNACDALTDEKNDISDFDLPISSILQCLSSSHKLDYIRLAKNGHSKQQEIIKIYNNALENKHKSAIAKYQSANKKDIIDGLKPHQYINQYLNDLSELEPAQKASSRSIIKNLDDAFVLSSKVINLQVGQRLYRGVSLTAHELGIYTNAHKNKTIIKIEGYTSTSLSESIAKSFAALSYLGRLRQYISTGNIEITEQLTELVIVFTNRRESLPFIVPDALRKPAHNQGQMEILLQSGLEILPTHFEFTEFDVKMYVDIV